MFLGTLSCPFFNHLIGSSSVGFTELILAGEMVEAGIRSGEIQRDASSSTTKKPFTRKKEVSSVYGQINQNKTEIRLTVGAVIISNPASNQQQNNHHRPDTPRRQFARINMILS